MECGKKENGACTTAATAIQTPDVKDFGQDFRYDFTSGDGKNQSVLLAFLGHGEENAVKADDLVNLLGISSARYLRQMISRERQNAPIIGDFDKGYYLPSDDPEQALRELHHFEASMLKRVKSHHTALTTCKAEIDRLELFLSDQLPILEE